MYDSNGMPRPLRRTSNLSKCLNAVKEMWTRLLLLEPPVKLAFGLTLLVLAMLLSGCATQSPPSVVLKNPQPPQLSEPIPSESYLSKAERLIESWLNRATGM